MLLCKLTPSIYPVDHYSSHQLLWRGPEGRHRDDQFTAHKEIQSNYIKVVITKNKSNRALCYIKM